MLNYEVGMNGKLILNWKEDLPSALHVQAPSLKVFLIEAHFHNSSITVFATRVLWAVKENHNKLLVCHCSIEFHNPGPWYVEETTN